MPSPEKFDGTLEELYERFVLPNLPGAASVRRCHELLLEYVERDDPLFLVRYVTGTTRGETYRTSDGSRFVPTDNAPVWWMHYITFRDELPEGDEFVAAMESAPHHFFDVARRFPGNISSAGWHVAHILTVKDGNTDYKRWPRDELVRRFVRNVHPCNHFLLPKAEWQRWGGDPRVIAFFAAAYAVRYGETWKDFLAFGEAEVAERPVMVSAVRYVCTLRPRAATTPRSERGVGDTGGSAATYRASRLTFRAAVIEPLAECEAFRVVTSHGTFEMTKAEFYEVFPNVVASASYQEAGSYNYTQVPRKALRFLQEGDE